MCIRFTCIAVYGTAIHSIKQNLHPQQSPHYLFVIWFAVAWRLMHGVAPDVYLVEFCKMWLPRATKSELIRPLELAVSLIPVQ